MAASGGLRAPRWGSYRRDRPDDGSIHSLRRSSWAVIDLLAHSGESAYSEPHSHVVAISGRVSVSSKELRSFQHRKHFKDTFRAILTVG
eukprot:416674-Amorphochlora_amoeboformis.AAC.1